MEDEKSELEKKMSSGTMEATAIVEAASRMEIVLAEIDGTEYRILELMEKEQ